MLALFLAMLLCVCKLRERGCEVHLLLGNPPLDGSCLTFPTAGNPHSLFKYQLYLSLELMYLFFSVVFCLYSSSSNNCRSGNLLLQNQSSSWVQLNLILVELSSSTESHESTFKQIVNTACFFWATLKKHKDYHRLVVNFAVLIEAFILHVEVHFIHLNTALHQLSLKTSTD